VNDDLFLRALAGEDTARAPVWIMRQAGRHLPEYRAMKERHDFWTLVRTPELAAEVTLQPLRRYGMDAAILFSDIMTPLPAMGLPLTFEPGPRLTRPVRDRAAVEALRVPEEEEIAPFVAETIRLLRAATSTPVIGFGGAPLTLATYAVEGAGSKEYPTFRAFLRRESALAHELLQKLADASIAYARMQIRAGAQAFQLFDSWAGLHDADTYATFGAPYVRRVLEGIADLGVARIYLALDAAHLEPHVVALPAEALSVDWRRPLRHWRSAAPGRVLQGNLDPAALLAPGEALDAAVDAVLTSGIGGAHVFNLGHGIFPTTNPDAVARLIDRVRAFDRHAAGAA
jgi:uroporphyrinogen decarboxylase